jgi:hypothetical protein
MLSVGFERLDARSEMSDDVLGDLVISDSPLRQMLLSMSDRLADVLQLMADRLMVMLDMVMVMMFVVGVRHLLVSSAPCCYIGHDNMD